MGGPDVPQGDVIIIDLDPAAMLDAYVSQRRRFAAEVASLDRQSLATPSRCARWSVADVLRHLCDVDSWLPMVWVGQIPFESFDPLVTPDEFVAASRDVPDETIRDRYLTSTEAITDEVARSDRERWGAAALSPLGFVPWWQSALHMLWDSWLHERDALLPLGDSVPVEADELEPALLYSLAIVGTLVPAPVDVELSGARLFSDGGKPHVTRSGGGVRCDEPTARVVDALAGRGELDDALSGEGDGVAGRVDALARYFRS